MRTPRAQDLHEKFVRVNTFLVGLVMAMAIAWTFYVTHADDRPEHALVIMVAATFMSVVFSAILAWYSYDYNGSLKQASGPRLGWINSLSKREPTFDFFFGVALAIAGVYMLVRLYEPDLESPLQFMRGFGGIALLAGGQGLAYLGVTKKYFRRRVPRSVCN